MKFKNVNQEEVSFTGLQGYIKRTRAQLVAAFGEPQTVESLDGKITTEWMLKFEDRTVATIYDWKRYDLGAPSDHELYDWHIGGYSAKAVIRVCEVVEELQPQI